MNLITGRFAFVERGKVCYCAVGYLAHLAGVSNERLLTTQSDDIVLDSNADIACAIEDYAAQGGHTIDLTWLRCLQRDNDYAWVETVSEKLQSIGVLDRDEKVTIEEVFS